MYKFMKLLAKGLFSGFRKMNIEQINYLPETGGYIVACSHTGWVDVVALGVALPRPIHFMAKKELFYNKLIASFLRKINAFPVNRENPGPSSLKIPVKLLKSGEVVGIFPSGTRSSEDVSLKRGAVTIANLSKVPIVPAFYHGPSTIIELLKGKKITIRFGEPFYIQAAQKEELENYTELLNQQINSLAEK